MNLDKIILFAAETVLQNSEPDTSKWVLENDRYKIVSKITDNVTFKVYDVNDKLVFDYNGEWQKWDFKKITFCENNDIIIETGDTGTETFIYSDKKRKLQ